MFRPHRERSNITPRIIRPKARPMRFTIRDLFWLMLVVGLSIGWATEHEREHAKARATMSLWQTSHDTEAMKRADRALERMSEMKSQLELERRERREADEAASPSRP